MIYLVDDDAAVRQAMTLLLRTYHKEVAGFPDGPHLLAHLDTARPGVLLLDLRMPVISRLQLIDQLGQRGIRWPAIMVTGHIRSHSDTSIMGRLRFSKLDRIQRDRMIAAIRAGERRHGDCRGVRCQPPDGLQLQGPRRGSGVAVTDCGSHG
ncbi:response regulator transcription factor [Paracoccus sp. IB05]|uniref:response regulator transcription factor n=1 Tax=Paracoccus sp. IB05 TaxID=2779367 RepID=UPI0018E72C4F|nr:response regulator [Paracoccus sp. IB05]MBJ2152718.1 response regulator [Paracoccus sp. IB05]